MGWISALLRDVTEALFFYRKALDLESEHAETRHPCASRRLEDRGAKAALQPMKATNELVGCLPALCGKDIHDSAAVLSAVLPL